MITNAPKKRRPRATRQERAITRLLAAVDRSIRAADDARRARDELFAASKKREVADA